MDMEGTKRVITVHDDQLTDAAKELLSEFGFRSMNNGRKYSTYNATNDEIYKLQDRFYEIDYYLDNNWPGTYDLIKGYRCEACGQELNLEPDLPCRMPEIWRKT